MSVAPSAIAAFDSFRDAQGQNQGFPVPRVALPHEVPSF
jgi:hypothetical protein